MQIPAITTLSLTFALPPALESQLAFLKLLPVRSIPIIVQLLLIIEILSASLLKVPTSSSDEFRSSLESCLSACLFPILVS